ncbi:MAG TPA: type II secretion system F family protein [bacterium]
MPTFRYTAKHGPKDVVEGRVDAESREAAFAHLARLGYTPVRIDEESAAAARIRGASPRRGRRVRRAHLNIFTRQFASLIRSGVPLLRSLGILAEQTSSSALRPVLVSVADAVRRGEILSEAMRTYPQVFPPLYVSLVRAGEVGGVLDTVLDRLAAQADRDDALRAKLQSALAYPMFVGVAGFGTVVFLLSFVMPRLLKLFEGFGERLPLATRLLLATSETMSQPVFWAGVVAAAGIAGLAWRMPGVGLRDALDRVSLRVPVARSIIYQVELARFCRSFGLLLDHGISILQAVEVAMTVVRHPVIRRDLGRLPELLRQGTTLAASLNEVPGMTPFVINTVAVGEEAGRAGPALSEVAAFHERDMDRNLQVAAALLEPAMVLLVGAIVGWIVMAVLLPIFELGTIV